MMSVSTFQYPLDLQSSPNNHHELENILQISVKFLSYFPNTNFPRLPKSLLVWLACKMCSRMFCIWQYGDSDRMCTCNTKKWLITEWFPRNGVITSQGKQILKWTCRGTNYAAHSLQAPPYRVSDRRTEKYYSVQGKPVTRKKPTQASWEENPGLHLAISTECLPLALWGLSLLYF